MQRVTVVILDLDNTLFDWVDIWHKSFVALLDRVVEKSGIERETLLDDFKAVFTRHGTSEYAFAIQELACLQDKHRGENIADIYDDAIHAFRAARRQALKFYPDVEETLHALKDTGCLLIGYTESMAFYTRYRMRKLGLDRILDYIYSPEDHDLPKGMTADEIRMYSTAEYKLRRTLHLHTPKGELKPNPTILSQIIRDVAAMPDEVVYIGDSLLKDISMAIEAKITSAWAKYGAAKGGSQYELLRRVTHWPQSLVNKERELSEVDAVPTVTLKHSFAEILDNFRFEPYIDGSPDRIEKAIDAWKTTVAVQQHFNELEMKVRNFALTVAGAVLASATFSIKEKIEVVLFTIQFPLATAILVAGVVVWWAFYSMDRYWYHKLLIGAVSHGMFIEKRYHQCLPELGLATAIRDASQSTTTSTSPRVSRSSYNISRFYKIGIVLLLVSALLSLFVDIKGPGEKAVSTSANGIDSSVALGSSQRLQSPPPSKAVVPALAPSMTVPVEETNERQDNAEQRSPNTPSLSQPPDIVPSGEEKAPAPNAKRAESE